MNPSVPPPRPAAPPPPGPEPEPEPDPTAAAEAVTAEFAQAADQLVDAAISNDAARKSWVDALMPVLGKPPARTENRTVRIAYEGCLIAIYDRMTRLMRSDLTADQE